MNRAFSTLTLRAVNEDQRIVEGIATTPRPDRGRDIVDPLGAVFSLPLPFLLDHDHLEAVGDVEHAEVTASGIKFRARIKKIAEPGPVRDLVDRGWALLKAGLRKSVSVGFLPLESEPITGGGYRYRRWEWIELSACTVPMNPDSVVTGVKAAHHVAKLAPVKPAHHVVKLTTRDRVEGMIRAAAEERRRTGGAINHVVRLTPEAQERAARIEAARQAIEERERRWRSQ